MARGYFHRGESEQYAFYRTPKILFTDPEYETLTALAKILYGVLLDRESLSDKNKWVDDRGRIFVYMTNKTICKLLHISDKTATKLLVELEKIDLIQRVRQGQGRPSKIYVKKFFDTERVRLLERNRSDSEFVDVSDQGAEILRCNIIKDNDTKCTDTNLISSRDTTRRDARAHYRQHFMETLEIDNMKERYPYDMAVIDEILEIILDTVCSTRDRIYVAGEWQPVDIVKGRFLALDSEHLEYVLQSMAENTTRVRKVKQYLLTALYNAPLTMNNYYRALARHDMT